MNQPPFLKKNDTIAIVATARKVSKEELEPAVKLLESKGFRVILPEDIYASDNQLAGSDETRAAVLQRVMDDPSIRAVLCARGGYGTVRIIDKVDFSGFCRSPKWLIGFSDITVLHSHVARHTGFQTLHAIMPLHMRPAELDMESFESLLQALEGKELFYRIPSHPMNKMGKATGRLIGGNLSVLYSLLGSASDVETEGCVLFLEDLDEYLYHIDRMVMNMKRNHKFTKLAGLVIGYMSDMKDNTIPFGKNAYEIIASHIWEFSFPVCFGFPAGHEKKNVALKFGASVELDVKNNESVLTFLNP